jgi:hypothetical protein
LDFANLRHVQDCCFLQHALREKDPEQDPDLSNYLSPADDAVVLVLAL